MENKFGRCEMCNSLEYCTCFNENNNLTKEDVIQQLKKDIEHIEQSLQLHPSCDGLLSSLYEKEKELERLIKE